MKKFALIAAVAATVAAPAFAQSAATVAAIQHFNLSAESASDIVTIPESTGERVSADSGALGTAFEILNRSADTPADLRGLTGATVYDNEPAYGAEIFERLEAADD
ncbi:hypothetical protein HKCCE4037_15435 [Rhodobacterales bacterium HKCCE4037]|nr:hypothetical protein [Rhodobacterales bacterium HKCCE4037]